MQGLHAGWLLLGGCYQRNIAEHPAPMGFGGKAFPWCEVLELS